VHPKATDALLTLLDRVSLGDADLGRDIDEVTRVAQDILGLDGVGVMLINRNGDFELVGASNPLAASLEAEQLELGDGPGFECTRRRRCIPVEDLEQVPRWTALARPGVRAVLAAPIWFAAQPVGNLNALCGHPRAWSSHDVQALTAYAGIVTTLLRNAEASRVVHPMVIGLQAMLWKPDGPR
jgi:GAF domain-containing protein